MQDSPQNRLRSPKCPACGSPVSWENIRLTAPFACPTCGSILHVPKIYSRLIGLASVVLACGLASLFELTLLASLVFVGVGFFPIVVILMLVVHKRLQPNVRLLESN